ncbi:MAG: tRNA (adenosine(37)-N6)-threonylcarbamoyltransferase complex dimerization subunit type 1 TsaB, partial [Leptospiraceae bacterium]|nr:tRNA (adenosine(37)-N6)-threonylcarbamoyltransferase complex dimerization subunit type 1 TsaB [Leptospiraceae bacterium]
MLCNNDSEWREKAMRILALDSSSGTCSAALGDESGLRAMLTEPRSAMQAERLLPLIEALLQQESIKYRDLDAVAVSIGPGSFTGIRIGLAAARGLALAADIPLIGVTTLEAAVHAALNRHGGKGIRRIAALLDARRGQCYAQHFMRGDATGSLTADTPRLLDYNAADGFIATVELIVTDHAALIADSAPCPVV